MNGLLENPGKEVSTISVDPKLSTLMPKHLSTLIGIYEFFQSEEGKKIILSGFRFTGISGAVNNARNGIVPSLDPYVCVQNKLTFLCWEIWQKAIQTKSAPRCCHVLVFNVVSYYMFI